MNYEEPVCQPTAPGQQSQAQRPPAQYQRAPYTNPTVVVKVPPSSHQFWPNSARQQYPVTSSHYPQYHPPQQHYAQQPSYHVQQQQQPYAYQSLYPSPHHRQALPPSIHLDGQNDYNQQPQPPQYHVQQAQQSSPYLPNARQPHTSKNVATPPTRQLPTPKTKTPAPVAKPRSEIATKSFITPDLPVDYRLLLLSLADDYIAQARSLASIMSHNREESDPELYYKLMATGMGCLEAVLKKYSTNMPPRQFASIQFRYAGLLYEETENSQEVESLLTKGVAFCDRNHLFDLKYSMQHLLTRALYKSNTKAATKYLDNMIDDALTSRHFPWVYAFRFLRVSLTMQNPTPHELLACVQDLSYIGNFAKGRGDSAIVAIASILQAVIRLHSRDVEAITDAQGAVALARAQQLNDSANSVPQLNALLHFVDMACSLIPYEHEQAVRKMATMQTYLDQMMGVDNWSRDGSFGVPLRPATTPVTTADTGGIFSKDSKGRDCLNFSWLGRPDVYLIGFLLSGQAVYYRNHQNRGAERFLSEGLKMTEDAYQSAEAPVNLPLSVALSRIRFRFLLKCHLLLHQTFCLCERSAWKEAQASLNDFNATLQANGIEPARDLLRFALYMKAVTEHVLGNLDAALEGYRHPDLTLPDNPKALTSPAHEALALLSTMNTVIIIRSQNHPSHSHLPNLLDNLTSYFSHNTTASSQNPHLQSYHHLLTAITSTPIMTIKKHLKASLDLANSALSNYLRALVLSFTAGAFFSGQMGEGPRDHALGARAAARQAGSKLWIAVTDGMVEGLLEREGRGEEAGKIRVEADAVVSGLGPGVRAMLEKVKTA